MKPPILCDADIPGTNTTCGEPMTFHEGIREWHCRFTNHPPMSQHYATANHLGPWAPDRSPEREHIPGLIWNGECYENIRLSSMDAQRKSDRRHLDSLPRRSSINWMRITLVAIALLLLARLC